MAIDVIEFTYGYNSDRGVDVQMVNFLNENKIKRDQIIDIRYAMSCDPNEGRIFQSALLVYQT
jgi:sporulation protein Cse60